MNKAIFLDRDGTINVDKSYLYRIEDFEFIPGVIDVLRLFQKDGYKLIIITNQSGIGRGYYTEEDFKKLDNWMKMQFRRQGVYIDATYYCPHHPDAIIKKYRIECNCRKPKLGLFERAIKDFEIDLSKSYAIGDRLRDCSICFSTMCRGYIIGNNIRQEHYENRKIKYMPDIRKCAELILGEKSNG